MPLRAPASRHRGEHRGLELTDEDDKSFPSGVYISEVDLGFPLPLLPPVEQWFTWRQSMTMEDVKAHFLGATEIPANFDHTPSAEELKFAQEVITLFCDRLKVPEGVNIHIMEGPVHLLEYNRQSQPVVAQSFRTSSLISPESVALEFTSRVETEMAEDLSKLRGELAKGGSYHYLFYRIEGWPAGSLRLRTGKHYFEVYED